MCAYKVKYGIKSKYLETLNVLITNDVDDK